jgi:hypothetical protein
MLTGSALGEGRFSMRLLHFRRTFVEKMFAIHSKIELFKRDHRPLGSYARHYYDLYQLGGQEEVLGMLQQEEYQARGLRAQSPSDPGPSAFSQPPGWHPPRRP